MISFPHFSRHSSIDLAGIWDFTFLGAADFAAVDPRAIRWDDRLAVPGVFDACPRYAGRRGVAVYRTSVETTPGRGAVVRFGGCGFRTRVFVDGQLVGTCDLPYSGFAVEVPASQATTRELVVVVDNRHDRQGMPLLHHWYDFYQYGGIYRDVLWREVGAWWIDRVQVTVEDAVSGRVRLAVRLGGSVPASCRLTVAVDGGAASIHTGPVASGVLSLSIAIPDPRPWSPFHPHLHTITVGGDDGDLVQERFGLRTVGTTDGRITINGEAVVLKGYCRHEAHPQFGPALPHAQLVQDLQLMRDMGCNFVRGAHYPQDQRFLDLCDELGVLVFEESLGWGYEEKAWAHADFISANVAQIEAMVANSYNHPSVIIWGFLNEGGSHLASTRPIYAACADAIRRLDRSRPVTYATNQLWYNLKTDVHLDLVDVVSLNMYPGWYSSDRESPRPLEEISADIDRCLADLAKLGHAGKPVLISEIGAAALYGWRDPIASMYSEQYQTDHLVLACREIFARGLAGVSLWQFADCRTYPGAGALGRPRTFNNKGSFDEYRRPKQAVEAVSRIFREIRADRIV